MSWNDYRAAMDELPISENFEDRICAAVREARRRRRTSGGRAAFACQSQTSEPCPLPACYDAGESGRCGCYLLSYRRNSLRHRVF